MTALPPRPPVPPPAASLPRAAHPRRAGGGLFAVAAPALAAAAVEVILPIVGRTMAGWGSEIPYYAFSTADMLRLPARVASALTLAWCMAGVVARASGRADAGLAGAASTARAAPRVVLAVLLAGAVTTLWLVPAALLATVRSDPALHAARVTWLPGLSAGDAATLGMLLALAIAIGVAARVSLAVPAAVLGAPGGLRALADDARAAEHPMAPAARVPAGDLLAASWHAARGRTLRLMPLVAVGWVPWAMGWVAPALPAAAGGGPIAGASVVWLAWSPYAAFVRDGPPASAADLLALAGRWIALALYAAGLGRAWRSAQGSGAPRRGAGEPVLLDKTERG